MNADDPEILFENQDNILENNLYTYCFNNPVNMVDSNGCLALTITAATFYGLCNIVLSIGITVVIGERIYRAVSYEKTFSYKYAVKLEKQTKKKTKKTGKEKADDASDWAKRQSYNSRKSADQNPRDVLNKKYGEGNWKKGPGSEFSQIKKWLRVCE